MTKIRTLNLLQRIFLVNYNQQTPEEDYNNYFGPFFHGPGEIFEEAEALDHDFFREKVKAAFPLSK